MERKMNSSDLITGAAGSNKPGHIGHLWQTLGHMGLELRREVWAQGRDVRLVRVRVDSTDIHKRPPRENG